MVRNPKTGKFFAYYMPRIEKVDDPDTLSRLLQRAAENNAPDLSDCVSHILSLRSCFLTSEALIIVSTHHLVAVIDDLHGLLLDYNHHREDLSCIGDGHVTQLCTLVEVLGDLGQGVSLNVIQEAVPKIRQLLEEHAGNDVLQLAVWDDKFKTAADTAVEKLQSSVNRFRRRR